MYTDKLSEDILISLCTNIVTGNHNSACCSRSRLFFVECLELGSARIVIISTCSPVFLSVWWLRHMFCVCRSVAFLSVFSSDWVPKPKFEISHQYLEFFFRMKNKCVTSSVFRWILCMWLIYESIVLVDALMMILGCGRKSCKLQSSCCRVLCFFVCSRCWFHKRICVFCAFLMSGHFGKRLQINKQNCFVPTYGEPKCSSTMREKALRQKSIHN